MSYNPQSRYLRRIQKQQETPIRLPSVTGMLSRINGKPPRNQYTISSGGLNSRGTNSTFQAITSTPISLANHRISFSAFERLGRLFTPQRNNAEFVNSDDESWADTTKSVSIDLSGTADQSLKDERVSPELEEVSEVSEIPLLHISQLRALDDPEAETTTCQYRIPILREGQEALHVTGFPPGFSSDGFYQGRRLPIFRPISTTTQAGIDNMAGKSSEDSGGSSTNTRSLDKTPRGKMTTNRRTLKSINKDRKDAHKSSPFADDGSWDGESDAPITPPRRQSKGKRPAHESPSAEDGSWVDESDIGITPPHRQSKGKEPAHMSNEDDENDWKTVSDASRTTRQHPSMGKQYAHMSDEEDEEGWDAESNASRTTAYRHPSMFKRQAYVSDEDDEDSETDREITTYTTRTPTRHRSSMDKQQAYVSNEGDEDSKANEDDEADWQTEYSFHHTPERQQSKGKHVSTDSDDDGSGAKDSDNSDLEESFGIPNILRMSSPEPLKKVSKFNKWFVNKSLARREEDIGPPPSHPLPSPPREVPTTAQSDALIPNFLGRLPFENQIQNQDARQKSAIDTAPAVLAPQPPLALPSKLTSTQTEPPIRNFLGAMSFENLDAIHQHALKNKSAIGPPPSFLPPAPPVRPPSRRGSTQTTDGDKSKVPVKGQPVAVFPVVDKDSAVKNPSLRLNQLRGLPVGTTTTSGKITPQGKERGAFTQIMSTIPKPGSGQLEDRSRQGEPKERSMIDEIPRIAPHLVPIGFEMQRRKAEGKVDSKASKPALTKPAHTTAQHSVTAFSNDIGKDKRHFTTTDASSKNNSGIRNANAKLGGNMKRYHHQLEVASGSKEYDGKKLENKKLSGGRKPAWEK